jgi:hypothetical protein
MATTPPPADDPDDDLIAYLDGELDDATAEVVEAHLADDPAARSRAAEYKKSFDLLDYLPKPEPSATFATRTMTRLMPAGGGSGSQPAAPRRAVWPEVLAWAVLAVLAGGVAFAGSRGWRAATTPPPAEPLLSDLPVIENLPVYAGVDDVRFARELVKLDLFDADPADFTPPARDMPTADRKQLIEQFSTLTPARQQQLRTLHQTLTDPATADRAALARTVEAYAAWLSRLPDADRKGVFDAPPEGRLDAVRFVIERRWREGLSPKQQEELRHVADLGEKQQLLQTYRAQEAARRQEWQFAQRQWKELTGKDKDKPWPFNDPALTALVDAYIHTAFGVDPNAMPTADKEKKGELLRQECRLTREEVMELRDRREAAMQSGYWFTYGALLLRLSEQHPTLPRPAKGEPITEPRHLLGKGYPALKDGMPKGRVVGKWPDFAEAVLANTKDAREKKLEPLGPCRPEEFTPEVKEFATATLPGHLTKAEKDKWDGMLGKWPDYPREMMRLAREKNLSVPEVSLPGEPNNWKKFYQLTPAKK